MMIKKVLSMGIAALMMLTLANCGKAEPKKLRVAVGATMPPYAYYRQGAIDGIEVAILREAVSQNDYTLQFEDVPFEKLIDQVKQGKFDVAIGAISISETRKGQVDFSVPYDTMPRVIVSCKHSPLQQNSQLPEKKFKIGIHAGTTEQAYKSIEKHDVFEFPNYGVAIVSMLYGNLDGVLCDRSVAEEYATVNPDVVILPDALFVDEFGIVVSKQHPEIRQLLDDVVTKMKQAGRLEDLKHQYQTAADERFNE